MRVQLLGRPAITGAGGPVELRGPRQAGLLALLGAEVGRVVGTSRIEDELWGGHRVSASAVRVNVNRLRARFHGVGGCDPIVSHTLGYSLDLEPDDIDIARFTADARAAFAQRAAGRPGAAIEAADAAERWWRGPAFAGVAELPSVQAEHVRLEALRLDVGQERAIALIELAAFDEALAQLDTVIAAAPHREAAWGLRLYALARTGRRAEAEARYQELQELLRRDLGIGPDPAIAELAHRVRAGDPEPAAAHHLLAPTVVDRISTPAPSTLDVPRRAPRLGPFVGRTRLLDELTAPTGSGEDEPAIAVVEGPPGMGKTRLAAEVAARARAAGATVLVGTCPRDGGSSLAAVADIVRGALAATAAEVDDLAALAPLVPDRFRGPSTSTDPDPEIRRLQLFDAASQALARIDGPRLVIVDDIHWVSTDGGRFLHHLLERSDCRWLLLARVGDRTPAAVDLLADLGRWQPAWHTVGPLTDAEVRELVEQVAPDGEDSWGSVVLDRAGGNPFYATELLRHLSSGGDGSAVPPGVEQIVAASMQRLGADAVRVAEALAVAREPVPHAALTAAVELEPAAVDAAMVELVAAGLALPDAPDPRLAHDLVIESVGATIGPGQRRRLHAALGHALAVAGPDRCAVALAHLLHDPAGTAEDDLDHVAAVALHQLNARSAYHEAVELGSRYLDATNGRSVTGAGLDARIQVATALMTAGPYGRGRALLDRIEPDVRRLGDASLSADVIIARGSVNVANPELAVQVDEARLVLDALDRHLVVRRIQLAALIAHHLALLGRTDEALDLLDGAEAENAADPDPTAQGLILAMRVQVASGSLTAPATTRRTFADLCAFAEGHPSLTNEAWRRLFALDHSGRDGTVADHRAAIDALAQTLDRFPRPELRWAVEAARAANALARGELATAEQLIIDAQVTGGELSVGSSMSVWVTQLFMLRYEQADLARMTPFLSDTDDSSYQLAARALVLMEAGDLTRTRALAAGLAERDQVLADAGAGWPALAAHLGDIAFATGDRRLAGNVLAELGPHAGTALSAHGFLLLGAADRTLGLALATLGELDAAVDALDVAYADDRRRGLDRWAGRAARTAATARRQRRASGDLPAARALDQDAARRLAPVELAPVSG